MNYYAIKCPDNDGLNKVSFNITAGSIVLDCTLYFDTDTISNTYNHWIMNIINLSSEEVDERTIVLYPNTEHFTGDSSYEFTVRSEDDNIMFDNLAGVTFYVGVNYE